MVDIENGHQVEMVRDLFAQNYIGPGDQYQVCVLNPTPETLQAIKELGLGGSVNQGVVPGDKVASIMQKIRVRAVEIRGRGGEVY